MLKCLNTVLNMRGGNSSQNGLTACLLDSCDSNDVHSNGNPNGSVIWMSWLDIILCNFQI
jgi:hypothetical protein